MGENSRCAMLLVFTPTTLAGDGVAGASKEGLAGTSLEASLRGTPFLSVRLLLDYLCLSLL